MSTLENVNDYIKEHCVFDGHFTKLTQRHLDDIFNIVSYNIDMFKARSYYYDVEGYMGSDTEVINLWVQDRG